MFSIYLPSSNYQCFINYYKWCENDTYTSVAMQCKLFYRFVNYMKNLHYLFVEINFVFPFGWNKNTVKFACLLNYRWYHAILHFTSYEAHLTQIVDVGIRNTQHTSLSTQPPHTHGLLYPLNIKIIQLICNRPSLKL